MTLRVRFLGSGDSFGSGGRLQACILLEWPDYRALLDCGASSLAAMRRTGIEPNTIDAILVSHFHGDHFGGVPFLLVDAYYGGRTRPLVIAGPRGVEARIEEATEVLFRGFAPHKLRYELSYAPLPDGATARIGPLEVTAIPVRHVVEVSPIGLRVARDGVVVGYTGDALWSDALPALATGSDLFISEASSFAPRSEVHVSYEELLAKRPQLPAKRIVLTHVGRDVLERRNEVQFEIADDGTTIEL